MGNGPSLAEHDLSLLKDHFKIGINRAFFLTKPIINFWIDKSLPDNHEKEMLEQPGFFTSPRSAATVPFRKHKRWKELYIKSPTWQWTKETFPLYGTGSSLVLASQLAYGLGCETFVFLGVDGVEEEDAADNPTHFYGWNPHNKNHAFTKMNKAARYMATRCPAVIFSTGKSEYFQRMEFEDLLELFPPKQTRDRLMAVLSKP